MMYQDTVTDSLSVCKSRTRIFSALKGRRKNHGRTRTSSSHRMLVVRSSRREKFGTHVHPREFRLDQNADANCLVGITLQTFCTSGFERRRKRNYPAHG